jgi:hypothetical protein
MHTKVTMEHATILKSFNSLESAFQRFQADLSSVGAIVPKGLNSLRLGN